MDSKHKEKITQVLPVYHKYLDSEEGIQDIKDRKERIELFLRLLSPDGLESMTELEFGQVISSLWASQMWGNKSYLVDNLLKDNDLENLKDQFRELFWGDGSMAKRYDNFRKNTKGFGTATIAEMLAFVHPDKAGLWNGRVRKGLSVLGLKDHLPFIQKTQLTGTEYQKFNDLLIEIQDELANQGIKDIDSLGMNYFLVVVGRDVKIEGEGADITPLETDIISADDFEHDDVISKLEAIGTWLGFEAESEKLIATGAKVDVVWQAKIANLGVDTYVFEVQRRGSVDSLILNLQKAQFNPSVQRLIVVATEKDIEKIRNEIRNLPESFRKAVSFMKVSDALKASELLSEFSEIINKLNLVQSEFAV